MSNAAKLFEAATTHHQAGRLVEAEKAYCQFLKKEKVNPDALRLLGGLYLQTGQMARAVECLEKAVRLRPHDAETLTNLASALRGMKRFDEALDCYRKAVALKPDYDIGLNNLASLASERGLIPEALELYAKVLRLKPDQASVHFNYGNALLAAGRGGEAIGRYEHALSLKPDYLEAMINLGMALAQWGKADQSRQWLSIAQTWFDKALQADPTNTMAMNNIGNVMRQQGKPQEALRFYREALRLRPDYAQAHINMATSLRDLGHYEEAIESCRNALRLNPNSADAYINLGALLQDMARHEEAIGHFAEALKLKSSSPDAQWNTSLSLLALGRYEEALPLHEIGLGIQHMRGEYPAPDRRWQGENISGKRLLIWAEQGLGDSLQFIRYAKLCKERGATILVLCPQSLRNLFRNCPFIDALPEQASESDFDVHAPMMSLPYIFNTTLETIPAPIPYLYVGDAARKKWAGKFAEKKSFKVGLVWAGNPREQQINANMIDRRRSMSLQFLHPLFDVENVEFYTLQLGANAAQAETFEMRERIIDVTHDIQDFEDTGAIMEHLDLLISVDTSVVHLAGGLGRPVWVLSRFDACWRWLQNRVDNPWYPSARVFGQVKPGDWAEVVERVKKELIAYIA